jgi:hypothetical protein
MVYQLHSDERMADPSADDALEEDMAEIAAANEAWREAERKLLSPSPTSSPEEPRLAPTTVPVPTPVHTEDDAPSLIEIMKEPYDVLRQYLHAVLPELPPASANSRDAEVEATSVSRVQNKRTGHTRRSRSKQSTKTVPSEDPQDESWSAPIRIRNEASGSAGVSPSAPLPTPADPADDNATASTSGVAPTAFRFSGNNQALLLAHARSQRYQDAIKMLPEDQLRLVLRRPAEIAAVRQIHPKPNKRPKNKGTRKDDDDDNRKVRTHIGEDGVETELWVCRALFKVRKGCGGIEYLESPCGYPVGTKDSWIRHLKDVHLGRVKRGA